MPRRFVSIGDISECWVACGLGRDDREWSCKRCHTRPSLRAQRSKERRVKGRMDCFVAKALGKKVGEFQHHTVLRHSPIFSPRGSALDAGPNSQ